MALGTTNISTDLVGTTLQTSSRDVGTLCKHSAVNMWSRYKPIKKNKVTGLTHDDYGITRYAGSGNYGIMIGDLTATVGESYNGANWVYEKPTGSSTSPFRIGDFREYEHAAKVAMKHSYGNTEKVFARFVLTNPSVIYFDIPRTADNTYTITIEDIYPLFSDSIIYGNYYLACDIYQRSATSGSPLATYYSELPIGYSEGVYDNRARTIIIPDQTARTAGEYKMHLYISSHNANIPIGQIRKNYPIYWTSANPNIIPMKVASISTQFTVEYLGLKPTSGWLTGLADEYRIGSYTNQDFGEVRSFYMQFKITNNLSHTAYIPDTNTRIRFNKIATWGSAPVSDYSVINIPSQDDIIIQGGQSVTITSQSIQLFPSTMPINAGSYSLGASPKLNYHNGTTYEEFTHSSYISGILTYTKD